MSRRSMLLRCLVLAAVVVTAACSHAKPQDTETSGTTRPTVGSDRSPDTTVGATDTIPPVGPTPTDPGQPTGPGAGATTTLPPGTGSAPVGVTPTTAPPPPPVAPPARGEVILYSRTAGFRHDSIPIARAVLTRWLTLAGFQVTSTEDAAVFTDDRLAGVEAVVFLMTTGDAVPSDQEPALERYVEDGGGWVGIHSASDTEYDWAFYGELVGAYFSGHPAVQAGRVAIEDGGHRSTIGLPASWSRVDEWYDFKTNPRGSVHVLATLDETSYAGGHMGADHPIAWCHAVGAGRSWYTAMGHTVESWKEPAFLEHVLGGIAYAATPGDACG